MGGGGVSFAGPDVGPINILIGSKLFISLAQELDPCRFTISQQKNKRRQQQAGTKFQIQIQNGVGPFNCGISHTATSYEFVLTLI